MSLSASSLTSTNQLELDQARGLQQQVTSHTEDFLKTFGLTHTWIGKYYFNGRYVEVTNDLSWKGRMLEHDFYSDFVTDFIAPLMNQNSKSLFITWQTDLSSKIRLIHGIHDYGIFSGFNILKVYDNHVENYGFGSDKDILEVSCNLPNSEELEMFCLYVRECIWQTDTLKKPILGDTGKCFSVDANSLESKKYTVPIPKSFSFNCNNHTGKLSRQLLICLSLLARGYGHKDIARIMGLSPRTVEFYLHKIKRQYNNPSTSELITTFNNSPLAAVNPHMLHGTK